ncbi:MAG: hypothetical protein US49_C0005G0021 [candidate division TM6 bacterium GW2011_GWF2_37_49]|nr:MAG: hypothetical protein US49_C0005G0021 [candidate division TM6 bacterium GW2011_GWF2_37_49]
MTIRCACLIFLFLFGGVGCSLYAMDPASDPTSREYLETLLAQRKNYDLQQALYNHFDKLHTPWIGEWLFEKIKGDHFGNIVLLYFDIRWYVQSNGLKPENFTSFFEDLMMFIFRFYQDTSVCAVRERCEAVANYDFLVKTKIASWAKYAFDSYCGHQSAGFNSIFEIVKSKFGISTNRYNGSLSYATFKIIPQSPALICSMQRSLWSWVGIYPDTIYFCDPTQAVMKMVEGDGGCEGQMVHEIRVAATEKFISFLNWIIFDPSNQQLKNGEKWAKMFSKSFKEICETEWVVGMV